MKGSTRYFDCAQIGVLMGLLLCTTLLLIYKLITEPITLVVSFGVAIVVLLIVWILIEYVFTDYIAAVILLVIIPVFAENIATGIEEFESHCFSMPVRCRAKHWMRRGEERIDINSLFPKRSDAMNTR